jgi:glycosyltransferase involved in cell wall biosynthesis
MKRILLVQPSLQPPGGGNGVAAWIIEALKEDSKVTVLSWRPVDLAPVNRYFGTSLARQDFRNLMPHLALRRLIDLAPVPLSLLKTSLLLRLCKKIKGNYDVIITANNEGDLGRPGIQYIHFPWAYRPRPPTDLRWYHGSTSFVDAYYRLCVRICDFSFERMKKNLTLVNSDWTGAKVKECHGIGSLTVYPPVAGAFPAISWDRKENGFVCVGRISPEKELEKIIEILAAVRKAGHDIHLHIIGSPDHPRYYSQIRRLAEANASWIALDRHVARTRLAELVAGHRYGIHGMKEEHLGMAVAEMIRGGCIVFAPRGGGQIEVVGNEERLLYDTVDEAVEKIARTISRLEEQKSLRAYIESRKDLFSTEHFVERIREIVGHFDGTAGWSGRFPAQPPSRRP